MKASKKIKKEQDIIVAAEAVFSRVGFTNAKMEDIAKEAGITKVTLYSYFQSKDNLQLAITFKALSTLIKRYEETILKNKKRVGLDSAVDMLNVFVEVCEENYLYSEALMSYFALIRSTAHGSNKDKLTEGISESTYFKRVQEIQNVPFKYIVREINRGRADGSIKTDVDPMLVTLAHLLKKLHMQNAISVLKA